MFFFGLSKKKKEQLEEELKKLEGELEKCAELRQAMFKRYDECQNQFVPRLSFSNIALNSRLNAIDLAMRPVTKKIQELNERISKIKKRLGR